MDDDICALVPLQGKMGIMWSNQNTQRFGFETHTNGTDPATWSADESPASQGALQLRYGLADDHISLMCASDGTLYAALKTGYDTPGQPKVSLLVRHSSGSWDDLYPVTSNEGTRPIVILNEAAGKLKVVYTTQETGGDILYRESLISNISFGAPITLIGGNPSLIYNYATSTHQTYNSEIVIMATDMTTGPAPILAVSVIATEGSGTSALSASRVSTVGSNIAAPDAMMLKAQFTGYPNPFSSNAVLNFKIADESDYNVTLYNSMGAAIAILGKGKSVPGKIYTMSIDGSRLSTGIYLVQLKTNTGIKTIKLIRN
jgi:hypothetical protein